MGCDSLCNRGRGDSRQGRVSPAQRVLENEGHESVSETSTIVINYSLKLMPQDADCVYTAGLSPRNGMLTRLRLPDALEV